LRKAGFIQFYIIAVICLLLLGTIAQAQLPSTRVPGAPVTLQNTPQRDTTNKTNSSKWRDEQAVISFQKLYSSKTFHPDTSLHHFHRRIFASSWLRDLGNLGSPVRDLMFTPEPRTGPTLGYHAFDAYRLVADSLYFYNTTRPYSSFSYQLGSKAEQMAQVLHTQNIMPNWNFAVQYRKINSPGYFKIQRNNHDFGGLTTNYNSRRQHYRLNFAFVYNKVQHDENGGIVADSFLTAEGFDDKRTVPVRFQDDAYSTRRSSVTNTLRDYSLLLVHHYTLGKEDTLYNEDSTQYTYRLIPRFRITHRGEVSSHKYEYKDMRPDSLSYVEFFNEGFNARDSVFTQQKWFYVDNALSLNGFLGKADKQVQFSAGIGNRIDKFDTEFGAGNSSRDDFSNYVIGELKKEALEDRQWSYSALAKLFWSGAAAGNLHLHAEISKEISKAIGGVTAGFDQRVNNAPYNFTVYQNRYFQRLGGDYSKESISQIFGSIHNEPLKITAGIRNYLVSNYIYVDEQLNFSQEPTAFSITQLWLRKAFTAGIWVLDNEILYQQKTGVAPLNMPTVMGRHQLSIETYLFGKALKVATGIDVRWHSSYAPAGYSPLLARFYYQESYTVSNAPEAAIFFNFKVKNFRAFVMGDQLQQFFTRNNIAAPGYPAQDALIRFGFNWVMIN
jgi:hypothetical protein